MNAVVRRSKLKAFQIHELDNQVTDTDDSTNDDKTDIYMNDPE